MLACTEHWDQYFRDMQGITEINENIVSQKFGAIQYIKVVLILPIKMPRRSWRTDRSILTVTRPYFNIFCHHEDKRKKQSGNTRLITQYPISIGAWNCTYTMVLHSSNKWLHEFCVTYTEIKRFLSQKFPYKLP